MNQDSEITLHQPSEISRNFSYIKHANKNLLIILMIFIIGSLISGIVIISVNNKLIPYLAGVLELFFMLLPTLILSRTSSLKFKTLYRLDTRLNLKHIIIAVFGLCTCIIFQETFLKLQESLVPSFLMSLYKNLEKSIEETTLQIIGGGGWIFGLRAIMIGALIPAISEESLFRGYYQRSLEEEMQPLKAILITAVIFAIIHINPVDIIPLFVVGLYLGILAYTTQNLLIPILIHFLNNAFLVLIIYVPAAGIIDIHTYNINPITTLIICIFSFTAMVFVWVMLFSGRKKTNQNLAST